MCSRMFVVLIAADIMFRHCHRHCKYSMISSSSYRVYVAQTIDLYISAVIGWLALQDSQ